MDTCIAYTDVYICTTKTVNSQCTVALFGVLSIPANKTARSIWLRPRVAPEGRGAVAHTAARRLVWERTEPGEHVFHKAFLVHHGINSLV